MRRFILAALVVLITLPCSALERWETLPPTPAPILTDRSGMADANGIKIHYAIYGSGVVTLPWEKRERSTPSHFQAATTASRHVVIAAARSTR
jgi:hypothetical protein